MSSKDEADDAVAHEAAADELVAPPHVAPALVAPATRSCVPSGDITLRVRSSEATNISLSPGGAATLDTSFKSLPPPLRRRLSRGLPMQLVLTAAVFDRADKLVSKLDHTCQVSWLVWDDVYSIQTTTNGRRTTKTALTVDRVIRQCLSLDEKLVTTLGDANAKQTANRAVHVVVQLTVDSPQPAAIGWVSFLLPKAWRPTPGPSPYLDGVDTGVIKVCP